MVIVFNKLNAMVNHQGHPERRKHQDHLNLKNRQHNKTKMK